MGGARPGPSLACEVEGRNRKYKRWSLQFNSFRKSQGRSQTLLPALGPGTKPYQPLPLEEYLEELLPGEYPQQLLELPAAEYLEDP